MLVTPASLRRLRATIAPVVEGLGYQLVAVEVGSGPGGTTLRVSIDHPNGIGITDCTKVSRQLSPTLDVEDPIASAYDLEVSTPGIERPVQSAEDFQRFAGCEVRVKPFGIESKKRTKGVLLGCTDGVVRVKVLDEVRTFRIEEIERANLALSLEQFKRLGQGLPPIPEANP